MESKRPLIFFLILILLGVFAYYNSATTGNVIQNPELETTKVTKVIDGDTIETTSGTIRLLGINTPEKGHYLYQEAKAFIKPLENKTIQLLRDKEDKDKYYRKLRYVFYEDKFVNLEIIENGFATAYILEDLKYKDKFLRAQKQAKNSKLGLWKTSNQKCADCILLIDLNPEQEYFVLRNNCTTSCRTSQWQVKDAGRNTFQIPNLDENQQITITSSKNVWNNDHDEFFLRDSNGPLVIYYKY